MSKKFAALLSLQAVVIALTGLLSGDVWYSIVISLIGVVFNFLVSMQSTGWFSVRVCICNYKWRFVILYRRLCHIWFYDLFAGADGIVQLLFLGEETETGARRTETYDGEGNRCPVHIYAHTGYCDVRHSRLAQ